AAITSPEILERRGAVAAEVALIAPQLAILVEVLRREDVARKRLDTFRHRAVAGGTDEAVLSPARIGVGAPNRRARHAVVVEIGDQRGSSPDAFEPGVRHLLSRGK